METKSIGNPYRRHSAIGKEGIDWNTCGKILAHSAQESHGDILNSISLVCFGELSFYRVFFILTD